MKKKPPAKKILSSQDKRENSKSASTNNTELVSTKVKSKSVTVDVNPVKESKKDQIAEKTTDLDNVKKDITQKVGDESKSQSVSASIKIFQIYYDAWQKELLDPQMVPLNNNTPVKSELYEFDVFKRLYETDYVKKLTLWGAVSWRFGEKTKLTAQNVLEDIQKNPGFDVYFCNPVMEIESLYHNVWIQGEISHPKFLAVVLEFFKAAQISPSELVTMENSQHISVANYFVGNQRFWDTYLAWIDKKLSLANKNMPAKVRELMHSKVADDKMLHGGATYVPFIVERLFSVFLKEHSKVIKSHKITLPKDGNVHLKLLREMKDTAIATKSLWLAACWVNYRNLYFTQMMGKDWAKENLPRITPKDILFS